MAFLLGAERMHLENRSTDSPRLPRPSVLPGQARPRRDTSAPELVNHVCVSCSRVAEHTSLRCGHAFCTHHYSQLFDMHAGTFVCNQEHHITGTRTRWRSGSSGYETNSFVSRRTQSSTKSRSSIKVVLEHFCLGRSHDDEVEEGYGSGEGVADIPQSATLLPDTVDLPDDDTTRPYHSQPAMYLRQEKASSTERTRPVSVEINLGQFRPSHPLEPQIIVNPGGEDSDSDNQSAGPVQELMNETDEHDVNEAEFDHYYQEPAEHQEVVVNKLDQSSVQPQYRYDLQYRTIDQVNDQGSSKYQFESPNSIIFEPMNGVVLIADTGNNRVKKYDTNMNQLPSFGGHATELNPGQFDCVLSLTSHQGKVVAADCGDPANGTVLLFNVNGRCLRRVGEREIYRPEFMVEKQDILYVLDCNKIKQFSLAINEGDDDYFLGEQALPPDFGSIRCFCKPDEQSIVLADGNWMCVLGDSCQLVQIPEPLDMQVDSKGYILVLHSQSVNVFTPLPDVRLFCRINLPQCMDYRSFTLLPNGYMVLCGWHGYVQLEFKSTDTVHPVPTVSNI